MESAFEWTSSATTRRYLTDRATIGSKLDANEYNLADKTTEQDVRGVRLLVQLQAILEEQTGSPRNATEIYLDLIRGTEIHFYPDADKTLSFRVLPDLSHKYTLLATQLGVLRQGRMLKFKSQQWYEPTDPLLDDFAPFITIK